MSNLFMVPNMYVGMCVCCLLVSRERERRAPTRTSSATAEWDLIMGIRRGDHVCFHGPTKSVREKSDSRISAIMSYNSLACVGAKKKQGAGAIASCTSRTKLSSLRTFAASPGNGCGRMEILALSPVRCRRMRKLLPDFKMPHVNTYSHVRNMSRLRHILFEFAERVPWAPAHSFLSEAAESRAAEKPGSTVLRASITHRNFR